MSANSPVVKCAAWKRLIEGSYFMFSNSTIGTGVSGFWGQSQPLAIKSIVRTEEIL